jgi:hypothetical protein
MRRDKMVLIALDGRGLNRGKGGNGEFEFDEFRPVSGAALKSKGTDQGSTVSSVSSCSIPSGEFAPGRISLWTPAVSFISLKLMRRPIGMFRSFI